MDNIPHGKEEYLKAIEMFGQWVIDNKEEIYSHIERCNHISITGEFAPDAIVQIYINNGYIMPFAIVGEE